ncbi:MAG: class I tRNA ligase family protein, partial [Candidatus Muirbacterium halophilum]|nr:class I tRNA ligase family protein [Candidatus Muirbacterium halophilum]
FLSDDKFLIGRNFANKLWNASRFVISNLEEYNTDFSYSKLDMQDKFILSKLNLVIKTARDAVDNFRFDIMSKSLYEFMWDDFCDWYIEGIKPYIYGDKKNSEKMKVACFVLDNALRLLHPVMPFITEEIHNHLTKEKKYLVDVKYPEFNEKLVFSQEEKDFALVQNISKEIRNLKANSNIKRSVKLPVIIKPGKMNSQTIFNVEYFSGCEIKQEDIADEKKYSKIVIDNLEILVDLSEHINMDEEKNRLEGDIKKLVNEIKRAENMLANKKFIEKAPEELVNAEKEKLVKFTEQKNKLEETYKNLFN